MLALNGQIRSKVGEVNILLLLAVFFGFGMLVFAGIALIAGNQSSTARKTLDAQKKAAYAKGQDDQKTVDVAAATAEAASPYRVYATPSLFGVIEIHYPRSWSGYAVENYNSSTQIDATFSPDVIRTKAYGNKENAYGAHVSLIQSTYESQKKQYDSRIKSDKLVAEAVTVSGIEGTQYKGKYDRVHNGIAIILPVRDKTLLIATDDLKYSGEFGQILAQSKINP